MSCRYDANFSKLEAINLDESINLKLSFIFLTYFVNEIYRSLLIGSTDILPGIRVAKFLIIKWTSYLLKLWNITGIACELWYLILHELCAAPRNFPVKWQWSRTFLSSTLKVSTTNMTDSCGIKMSLFGEGECHE